MESDVFYPATRSPICPDLVAQLTHQEPRFNYNKKHIVNTPECHMLILI